MDTSSYVPIYFPYAIYAYATLHTSYRPWLYIVVCVASSYATEISFSRPPKLRKYVCYIEDSAHPTLPTSSFAAVAWDILVLIRYLSIDRYCTYSGSVLLGEKMADN